MNTIKFSYVIILYSKFLKKSIQGGIMNLSTLQNGSDIRGISMGEHANLTTDVARRLGRSFAFILQRDLGKPYNTIKVAIGRDSRLTGKALLESMAEGIMSTGIKVYNCGLATTPAMFMSTQMKDFMMDGAIMVTASHLPKEKNGFKFFTSSGGFDKEDITDLLIISESEAFLNNMDIQVAKKANVMLELDLMKAYSKHLKNLISTTLNCNLSDKPLDGLHIVVDAGNGAAGFFATEILEPLGANIGGSQFLEPNGEFPNHPANPENAIAIESVKKRVIDTGADLGLIFDTDVDRSAAISPKGTPIARDAIVALASYLVHEKYPGGTIVTDSVTTSQLTDFIENDLKMKHLRYKRGYKNVINKAKELESNKISAPLAIETSGHAAFKDNYYLDDGAYLATLIVCQAAKLKKDGKDISYLISTLKQPAEVAELRIPIIKDNFSTYGENILRDFKGWAEEKDISLITPNYEGVRVDFGFGWILMRKSLHDPLIVVNMASDRLKGLDYMTNSLLDFLRLYNDLDLSVFETHD